MENQIYKLTSGLIRMKPLHLFLLITIPLLFKFFTPTTDGYVFLNRLIVSIGSIILFAWVYAVGQKSKGKLFSQGIQRDIFKYFNWVAALTILFYVIMMFANTREITNENGMQMHFTTLVDIAPIMTIFGFTETIFIASKMLVSAEQNKEAEFEDYCNTFLLFMIASIGLWFIQPRIQKL